MKHKIIIIIIFNIFSCNNKVGECDVLSIEKEGMNMSEEISLNYNKQDSVLNYKFSTAPLDSFFCDLEEKQITKMDLIKKDTILLGIFRITDGLESIYIRYNKNFDCCKDENFMKPITQLIFNNVNNAQNSFSIFVKDLFGRSNFYIWYLKAGAICFIEENSIYLIKVNTCDSNKEIDLIEKVIREQVFKNAEFKGVKVYCGLQNPQML